MAKEITHSTRPWERQPGEGLQAFQAFRAWLETTHDGGRNIRETYRQLYGKPEALQVPGYFSKWVSKYQWAARARHYDNEQMRAEQEVAARQRAHRAKRRVERWDQLEDEAWDNAQQLLDKAKEILKAPTFLQKVVKEVEAPDGKTIIQEITIEPGRFSLRDAGTFIDLAEKLRRLSLEAPTSIVENVTPETQATKRLNEACAVVEESRRQWPDVPEDQRIKQIADAFGVSAESLALVCQSA